MVLTAQLSRFRAGVLLKGMMAMVELVVLFEVVSANKKKMKVNARDLVENWPSYWNWTWRWDEARRIWPRKSFLRFTNQYQSSGCFWWRREKSRCWKSLEEDTAVDGNKETCTEEIAENGTQTTTWSSCELGLLHLVKKKKRAVEILNLDWLLEIGICMGLLCLWALHWKYRNMREEWIIYILQPTTLKPNQQRELWTSPIQVGKKKWVYIQTFWLNGPMPAGGICLHQK